MPEIQLGIVLVSGTHAQAHAALLFAAGAAALGRTVAIFATGAGVRALCADWAGLEGAGDDDDLRARGVAGFAELRTACLDLGVWLIACESGLRGGAIDPMALLSSVERSGMTSFLEATREAQLISF